MNSSASTVIQHFGHKNARYWVVRTGTCRCTTGESCSRLFRPGLPEFVNQRFESLKVVPLYGDGRYTYSQRGNLLLGSSLVQARQQLSQIQ